MQSLQNKIDAAIVEHVFKQSNIGLTVSLFCATFILVGLFGIEKRLILICWYITFWVLVLLRYALVKAYFQQMEPEINAAYWRRLFSLGAMMSGLCWGFLGSVLLPYGNLMQLSLTLFILAGITSGAVPLLSGIRSAILLFLSGSLIPLIVTFFIIENGAFLLFNTALIIYFIYLILLSIKSRAIIASAIELQYQNEVLVHNLSSAKHDLEEINIKLDHAAKHDPLTNLANRSLFEFDFGNAIWRAQQEHQVLALFYLDIDNFKEINDAYGHHVGDSLLQMVVERIKRKLPNNATASRLGGDEMTIILENVKDLEQVAELARKICESLAMPFEIKDLHVSVTSSIGISIYPIDGQRAEVLLNAADKAMYYVKQRGGNNIHFNTEIDTLKTFLSGTLS